MDGTSEHGAGGSAAAREAEVREAKRQARREANDMVRVDATSLRGIAHPLRVRMLGMLRVDGPATATLLAQRLRLTTGATSYHLRQLAQYGFVVEDTGRGQGKERWWKAAHFGTDYNAADFGPETAELGTAFMHAIAATHADEARRAVDEMPSLPDEWRALTVLSDMMLVLRPQQVRRLLDDLRDVVDRHMRETGNEGMTAERLANPPAGAAPVVLVLHAFRRPGVTPPGEES